MTKHPVFTFVLLMCLGLNLSQVALAQENSNSTQKRDSVLMDIVAKKAKDLASLPYEAPNKAATGELATLDYDAYRQIRFNPEKAIWLNQTPFEIQLFHPGFLYNETVEIQTVNREAINNRVPFDSNFFIYGAEATRELAAKAEKTIGYTGFRVHYPVNTNAYKDELAVFQGASYFRMVGVDQVYGLSARGLAIDTASSSGEEFPRFSHFWLIKPNEGENDLYILALLNSPSVTGAFRFKLSANTNTTMDVDAVLFARRDINKLGIAPLTSMFYRGEAGIRFHDDFRPEIHDSDGLIMKTGGNEWIWRPISNPKSLQVTSLMDVNPKGFGLAQRDRDFEHYLDLEAHYHERPSLWVEPLGDWGPGRVELVEIPTDTETNDNIVAYWIPEQPLLAGKEMRFSYRLHTFDGTLAIEDKAQATRTLIGWGGNPGQANPPPRSKRQFAVDFSGPELNKLPEGLPLKVNLSASTGTLSDIQITRLPDHSGWRAAFKVQPENDTPVDMRLFIELRGERLTEVWTYVWNPNSAK